MTEKMRKQIEQQLPAGERINRAYLALEGDIRVITVDKTGKETRYTVEMDSELNARIRRM